MKMILSLLAVLLMVGCNSKVDEAQSVDTSNIIIDNAYAVLDNEKLMQQYRDFNGHLITEFDIDFRTITTSDDVDIDSYANKEFAKLQENSRSQSGKAILMVVNTLQDKVRLEVSMALEPVYTDAFISYIERKGFVPYFRDGKFADAIYAAAELISDRAYEARDGKEFMPPMESKSIGAGAKTKAHIGVKDMDAKKGDAVVVDSTDAPKQVLQKYLGVLKKHNRNPNLDIYTDATKAFFRTWTVTTINQDHEVDTLSRCTGGEVLYADDNIHAVLAHRPYDKHRKCAPYFFKKEQGAWKIDIATMAQTIRFNVDMQWHFNLDERLKKEGMYYAFAFDGYGFDGNGYPRKAKNYTEWDKYRWKYTCGGYLHPGDDRNNPRCWIKYALPGGAAYVRLGFDGYDKIYGFGKDFNRKTNVTKKEIMDYLNNVPHGEVATIILEHYYLNGKETYKFDDILNPNVEVRYETRQGIAP